MMRNICAVIKYSTLAGQIQRLLLKNNLLLAMFSSWHS